MRKFILVPALALGVLLGSCATARDPGAPPPMLDPNTAVEFVMRLKGYAIQFCGFEPTLNVGTAVVAQLMAAYFPAGVALQIAAHAAAQAICSGVDADPAAARALGTSTRKKVSTPRGTITVPGRYVGR